jgi:ABC-type phosphate transport system substrate-binding protein
LKRILTRLAVSGALVTVGVSGLAPAAHAGDDGTVRVLSNAGSDTTYPVMEALAYAYNLNATYNPDGDLVVSVPPLHSVSDDLEAAEAGFTDKDWLASARKGWPTGEVVPYDASCAVDRHYGGQGALDNNNDGDVLDAGDARGQISAVDLNGDADTTDPGETAVYGLVAPNGSSSGRTYALDSANNPIDCVDLARSSSAPGTTQQVNFDTWAFALDAIDWTYFPGNTHGVLAVSQAQLGEVYTCATVSVDANTDGDFNDVGDDLAGAPKSRFWGDLSGNPGDVDTIQAYRIQLGSGTGEDVAKTLYGLTAASAVGSNCTGGANAFYPTVQEHDCRNVTEVDKPDAICAYGYSRWKLQSKNVEFDKRNGSKFGAFAIGAGTPILPSPSTISETAATNFDGSRLVYTLITKNQDGTGTDLAAFNDALTFTGVEPDPDGAGPLTATKGFICSNAASKIIKAYGLVTLKNAVTDTLDTTYGSSYCRHNKYAIT